MRHAVSAAAEACSTAWLHSVLTGLLGCWHALRRMARVSAAYPPNQVGLEGRQRCVLRHHRRPQWHRGHNWTLVACGAEGRQCREGRRDEKERGE